MSNKDKPEAEDEAVQPQPPGTTDEAGNWRPG